MPSPSNAAARALEVVCGAALVLLIAGSVWMGAGFAEAAFAIAQHAAERDLAMVEAMATYR
ncbi:MAG: hypothetical protein AAFW46_02405 [Pseudomonadota bacterium]